MEGYVLFLLNMLMNTKMNIKKNKNFLSHNKLKFQPRTQKL